MPAARGWRAAAGRPRRLLAAVSFAASAVTAVLSLDATVVLLTPVVFATAARLGARAKPHVCHAGRRAGQRDQQPARRAGAAAADRPRRTRRRARRPCRGEYRP